MREKTLPARSLQQHVRKKLAQHAIKRLFSAIFRSLGELFRAHARIKASQGEFAHRTQRPGDAETNNTTAHPRHGTAETAITSAHPQQGTTETAITSAPKNRTKNAHFSPAKAMAVSNHRASSPAAPTRSARGRRRDPISTHSHAIPPTHTSRLDTQSLKFQAIHRATNHRRQGIACETKDRAHFEAEGLAGQRADAPSNISHEGPTGMEGAGGQAAAPVGGSRAWPGNTQTPPTDWRPPRGLRGQGGPRDDAPSEARGADGERAGRPRGGRRSVGATSSPAPRSTTRPWGASTTRQRVGRLAAPHPSTPIVQQAITLSPAPRRG